jgi:hypothetical protein
LAWGFLEVEARSERKDRSMTGMSKGNLKEHEEGRKTHCFTEMLTPVELVPGLPHVMNLTNFKICYMGLGGREE